MTTSSWLDCTKPVHKNTPCQDVPGWNSISLISGHPAELRFCKNFLICDNPPSRHMKITITQLAQRHHKKMLNTLSNSRVTPQSDSSYIGLATTNHSSACMPHGDLGDRGIPLTVTQREIGPKSLRTEVQFPLMYKRGAATT